MARKRIVQAMDFGDGRYLKELSELSVGDWIDVLQTNPEFIDRVDLSNFYEYDLYLLLAVHPEVIDKTHFLMLYFKRMSGQYWDKLLSKQPQLAKYRPKEA